MKKKLFVTILSLVIVLSLAACGECQHEWTEADCLNAAVCTKCEEVGEAALGHDFAPATCTDPEICARCGEAQGEALGHAFADWTFTKTEKSRTCTRCNQTEFEEIDEETYARHLINGHWDTYTLVLGGTQYNPNIFIDSVTPYLDITDTRTIYSPGRTEVFEMTLEYQEYDESEGWYLFTGKFEDNSGGPVVLIEGETENILSFIFDANNFTEFSKYEQEKAVTAATWVCAANGTVYSINLKEDGTFTADLGEDISGIWQMKPTMADGNFYSATAHWPTKRMVSKL